MTKRQKGVKYPGDLALVRRCQAGEEAAWRDLYARYKGLCFYLAERYGCRGAFDDLHAELMSWLAGGGLEAYGGDQPLASLISRRFGDLVSEFLRRARRERFVTYYDGLEFQPATCEVAEKEELYRALQQSEESLPAEEQDILEDYYIKGEKLETLARTREIVASTALRRLRKAREHLKSAMEEKWQGDFLEF